MPDEKDQKQLQDQWRATAELLGLDPDETEPAVEEEKDAALPGDLDAVEGTDRDIQVEPSRQETTSEVFATTGIPDSDLAELSFAEIPAPPDEGELTTEADATEPVDIAVDETEPDQQEEDEEDSARRGRRRGRRGKRRGGRRTAGKEDENEENGQSPVADDEISFTTDEPVDNAATDSQDENSRGRRPKSGGKKRPRKERGGRRRRSGKEASDEGAVGGDANADSEFDAVASSHSKPESDRERFQKSDEVSKRHLSAESDDDDNDAMDDDDQEDFTDLNVPTWDEIIGSLYRPNR